MLKKVNDILRSGGVIAFPTDTVWGIGCLPQCQLAVQRIYDIKKREKQKPLILMSYDINSLLPYIDHPFPQQADILMKKYWPGALTLVVQKSRKTPGYLTSNKDTVGIRVPDNNVFAQICRSISGHVLATTSANISGEVPALTYQEAMAYIGDKVDFVVPYEQKISQRASTVVGIKNEKITIFRQGDVIVE